MTIGSAIRAYRKSAGLTLEQLAEQMRKYSYVGTTAPDICRYEKEDHYPNWDTICAMVKVLGPGFVEEALKDEK